MHEYLDFTGLNVPDKMFNWSNFIILLACVPICLLVYFVNGSISRQTFHIYIIAFENHFDKFTSSNWLFRFGFIHKIKWFHTISIHLYIQIRTLYIRWNDDVVSTSQLGHVLCMTHDIHVLYVSAYIKWKWLISYRRIDVKYWSRKSFACSNTTSGFRTSVVINGKLAPCIMLPMQTACEHASALLDVCCSSCVKRKTKKLIWKNV